MGHHITALVIAAPYDRAVAEAHDLRERLAWQGVVVFPIDHFWSAYWQAKRGDVDGTLAVPPGDHLLPSEGAIRAIVRELTGLPAPRFAVIYSDYFGGVGSQAAIAYEGDRALLGARATVDQALHELGVRCEAGQDEWDTIGLASYRRNPDYLDRYRELCDELGV